MAAVLSLSLRRQLAFRADIFFQALVTAASVVSGLASLGVVFSQTRNLAGWTAWEAVALLGTYQVASGLLATFVEPNLQWFSAQVRDGRLDEVLLKPAPSIVLASLGRSDPLSLSQVLSGLALVGVALYRLGAPGPPAVLEWLLLLGAGVAISWAFRVLTASAALFALNTDLSTMFESCWQFGRYPVTIYRQPFRGLLTFVLPVAFVSTLPAQALTRGISLLLLPAAVLAAALAVGGVGLVWSAGLRRYRSATS